MAETERLQSWKEIAVHLRRSVATAQRWEREEGLPVHRHFHRKLGSVYAYASEIDAWRDGAQAARRQPRPESTSDWERARPHDAGPRLRAVARIGGQGGEEVRHFRELSRLGIRAFLRGNVAAALELGTAQLQIADALHDDGLRAEALIDLAFLELGNPPRAAEHARQAIAALRKAEDAERATCRSLFVEARILSVLVDVLPKAVRQSRGDTKRRKRAAASRA